ncbi:MAG: site-specific integrase [Acidimicrobiia bacterium]|nr:site-specific integrase [Acidimicrobiia bacterium]
MLSTLFTAAMKRKLNRVNQPKALELPKVVRAKTEPSNIESVRAILEQAPIDVRVLFQPGALTGLRRGEILALQWRDADWLNSELIVGRALPMARSLVKTASEGKIKRFHDLRHFYASMLIAQGESPKYIQDQLGHASITTTFDVYGHLMPQARREASAKLAKTLFTSEKANVRP